MCLCEAYLNDDVEVGLSCLTRIYFEGDRQTGWDAFRSNSNARHGDLAWVDNCWLNVGCKRTENTNQHDVPFIIFSLGLFNSLTPIKLGLVIVM